MGGGVQRLLLVASLCLVGLVSGYADGPGPCDAGNIYDLTYPTGMFFSWSSSSGTSGRIEYFGGHGGTAVPEETFENGVGGIRRRVVFANGNADCTAFLPETTNHRNQTAGVSFTNTIIMYLAFRARPCVWPESFTTPLPVNPAGVLWMPTDEEPEHDGRIYLSAWDVVQNPNSRTVTYPMASITRDRPGTHGGMPMAREIMKGKMVTLLWPGTGAIDPAERAALKELYTIGISAWTWDAYTIGTGGTTMTRADFIADASNISDPCGGSGNVSSRLDGVTCIGGHVVGLLLHFFGGAHLHSLPASTGAFKHLRSFVYNDFAGGSGTAPVVRFDAAIGNWRNLESFIYCGKNSIANQQLALPSSMGLWRNMTMIHIHSMDISLVGDKGFPTGIFSSPSIVVLRLDSVPLQALPSVAAMSNLSVFTLTNNGMNGPMPSFKGGLMFNCRNKHRTV